MAAAAAREAAAAANATAARASELQTIKAIIEAAERAAVDADTYAAAAGYVANFFDGNTPGGSTPGSIFDSTIRRIRGVFSAPTSGGGRRKQTGESAEDVAKAIARAKAAAAKSKTAATEAHAAAAAARAAMTANSNRDEIFRLSKEAFAAMQRAFNAAIEAANEKAKMAEDENKRLRVEPGPEIHLADVGTIPVLRYSTSFMSSIAGKKYTFIMSNAADAQRAEKGFSDISGTDDLKLLETLGMLAPAKPFRIHNSFKHLIPLMPQFFKGLQNNCSKPLNLLTFAECEETAIIVRQVLERVNLSLRDRAKFAKNVGADTEKDINAIADIAGILGKLPK